MGWAAAHREAENVRGITAQLLPPVQGSLTAVHPPKQQKMRAASQERRREQRGKRKATHEFRFESQHIGEGKLFGDAEVVQETGEHLRVGFLCGVHTTRSAQHNEAHRQRKVFYHRTPAFVFLRRSGGSSGRSSSRRGGGGGCRGSGSSGRGSSRGRSGSRGRGRGGHLRNTKNEEKPGTRQCTQYGL
jgi:hypothetical protein